MQYMRVLNASLSQNDGGCQVYQSLPHHFRQAARHGVFIII